MVCLAVVVPLSVYDLLPMYWVIVIITPPLTDFGLSRQTGAFPMNRTYTSDIFNTKVKLIANCHVSSAR